MAPVFKTLHNLSGGFHFGQWNTAIFREIEFQETAQVHGRVVFLIDLFRILMEQLIIHSATRIAAVDGIVAGLYRWASLPLRNL